MDTAAEKSTPSARVWLPLNKAFDHMVQRIRSPDAAEARLRRILEAGQWRGESFDGTETFDGSKIEGDIWPWAKLDIPNCAATFEVDARSIEGGTNLYAGAINWVDPDYDERTGEVLRPSVLYLTTLALKAIEGIACIEMLLPTDSADHATPSADAWIQIEVGRRKAKGDVPGKITEFSKELAEALANAAVTNKSLRVLKPRTIENRLRDWQLWPIQATG
jgi:hypothetical protein